MFIKIVGFKCHIDTSYEFDRDSMVLLKGGSGAGKSTILQAIYWALYGSLRGVYNNSGLIKTCSVTLKINHLVIYRQKRPELLRVTINNNVETPQIYEDTVAQQIIDQAFGTRELWKSCSYVGQKEICSLLSGSSSERLELLNQLSFHQDNPKEYISKVDQQLKIVNEQFIKLQAEFTAEVNLYSQKLTTRPVTVTLSDDDIKTLSEDINQLETSIKLLYDEVLSHERNKGSHEMITNQIASQNAQLTNIPPVDSNYETQYQDKVSEINPQNSNM